MTITSASIVRLALLGLVGGLFQLSVVSQVTVFGVPADLTPLMVAACGLIAGSMTGAVFGFCLGLFIDVSLYQTLGVSSLVFTASATAAGASASCATRPTASPRSPSAPPRPRSPPSASRCCSSCSACRRRSRSCCCGRSC